MHASLAIVVSLLMTIQAASPEAAPPQAQEGPQQPELPMRVVVTGVTLLSDFQKGPDGRYQAIGFEDVALVIQDNTVNTILSRDNFRLTTRDIAVSGRGRYAIACPIIFTGTGPDARNWLRGGSLLAAGLAGVGSVAMPAELVQSQAGRCAVSRMEVKEFPGAMPIASVKDTPPTDAPPYFVVERAPEYGQEIPFYMEMINRTRELQEAGHSSEAILHALTNGAAERINRSDLGVIEPGSRGMIVVVDGDPLADPSIIFDPFAVVFQDRVLRRAEIEVMRDSSAKSRRQVDATSALAPAGAEGRDITRWLVSVAGQIFGGVAGQPEEDGYAFSSVQGEPRFDSTTGSLRRTGQLGKLTYSGTPINFIFTAESNDTGLSIELSMEGEAPITAESPGATAPPLMELAADLALRSAELAAGRRTFEVQELIYGEGPIGLAPRILKFTPLDASECPPCMVGQGDAWRLEVMDPAAPQGPALSTAYVAFQDGVPSRIRIESSYGPSWYDQVGPGRLSLD